MNELHPDLAAHLVGDIIRHPLVTMPYLADQYELFNSMLLHKTAKLERAEKSGDWRAYLWLYERPYRPEMLLHIANRVPSEHFWALVAQVWMDAEFIHHNKNVWIKLWKSKRPFRDRLMTAAERAMLSAIPHDRQNGIRVYRGIAAPSMSSPAVRGLSWTTDRKRAAEFAKHRAMSTRKPILVRTFVHKEQVQAFFARRNESEVIILPSDLGDIEATEI